MEILIKYFDNAMVNSIQKIEIGDWIDLRSAEGYYYNEGSFLKINLGIAMQLPKGYEAHIVPRGSTFKNFGLIQTNSTGIIDESYCGDNDCWFVPMYSLRSGAINKGDRICQFRIVKKMEDVTFVVTDSLSNPDRGGFGHTGVA